MSIDVFVTLKRFRLDVISNQQGIAGHQRISYLNSLCKSLDVIGNQQGFAGHQRISYLNSLCKSFKGSEFYW